MLQEMGQPDEMLGVIFDKMVEVGLPTDLLCDHVCYRVATLERYLELKDRLRSIADLAAETPVSGRPISIFTLHTPYRFGAQEILCLELPAPKPGSPYAEGWEHAEFVVTENMVDFMTRYPHIQFNCNGMNKVHNPEAGVKLTGRYQIKFHPRHILDVIALEKNAA